MTTSGTVTFTMTRDDICNASLRLVGAIDPENTAGATTNQVTYAAQALNLLIKQWEAIGLQLWERRYGAIFPQVNQQVYVLGDPSASSGDHACVSSPLGYGFIKTNLTNPAVAGATTIVLDTISTQSVALAPVKRDVPMASVGLPAITIASTWYIGIQQDNGIIFWTTVNGAPSGTTVTLTAGLTYAASASNTVYSYQTKLVRPLRVLDGFFRQNAGNDIPALIIPRENYNRFGMKSSNGTTIQLYYDPSENKGNLYVYPTTNVINGVLYIEYTSPIQDMDASSDNFDFPQEWLNALKWNLALAIAPEYEVAETKFKQLQFMAEASFEMVKPYDQEFASMYIQPSNWTYTDNRGF